MLVQNICILIAGLGFFFFGMTFSSEVSRQLFSSKVKMLILRLMRNDLLSSFCGFVVGLVTQETAIVTFLAASLASEGEFNTRKALPLINWCNPGGCVLIFFVFLNVNNIVYLLVGILSILLFLEKFYKYQSVLKFCLGIVLMLYGLFLVDGSMEKIIAFDYISKSFVQSLGNHYWLLFLTGAILSTFAQSFIIFVLSITLAQAELLSLHQVIFLILGAHLGLSLSSYAMFAYLKGVARQIMMAQVLFDFLASLFFTILLTADFLLGQSFIESYLLLFFEGIANQITFFIFSVNFFTALLLMPFVSVEVRFLEKMFPVSEESHLMETPRYLNLFSLSNPSIAVDLLKKEITSIVSYFIDYNDLDKMSINDVDVRGEIDLLHKKFSQLFMEIRRYLLEVISVSHVPKVSSDLLSISKMLELLINIEQILHEKSNYICYVKRSTQEKISLESHHLLEAVIELDMVFFSFFIETVNGNGNFQDLILSTSNDSQVVDEFRNRYLERVSKKEHSIGVFIASLLERELWLIHQFADQYYEMMILTVTGESGEAFDSRMIIDCLDSPSLGVQKKGIEAASMAKNPLLIPHLLSKLTNKDLYLHAFQALLNMPPGSAEYFYNLVGNKQTKQIEQLIAIRVLGAIDTEESAAYLLNLIIENPLLSIQLFSVTILRGVRSRTRMVKYSAIQYQAAKKKSAECIKKLIVIYMKIRNRDQFLSDLLKLIIYNNLEVYLSLLSIRQGLEKLMHIRCFWKSPAEELLPNTIELLNFMLRKDKMLTAAELEQVFLNKNGEEQEFEGGRELLNAEQVKFLFNLGELSATAAAYCINKGFTEKNKLGEEVLGKNFSVYMNYIQSISQIKKMELFKNVANFASLIHIASVVQVETHSAGKKLFNKGDPSNSLLLIDEGRLSISDEKGNEIAVLGPGACIGELGLLEGQPRSATVTVKDACKLLVIKALDFNYLITLDPEIAKALLVILSQRIRHLIKKSKA